MRYRSTWCYTWVYGYVERYMVRCRPRGTLCWMVMYEVVWCCIELYGGA